MAEVKWIYESPDGGKTIYRRKFMDYDYKNRECIRKAEDETNDRVRKS